MNETLVLVAIAIAVIAITALTGLAGALGEHKSRQEELQRSIDYLDKLHADNARRRAEGSKIPPQPVPGQLKKLNDDLRRRQT